MIRRFMAWAAMALAALAALWALITRNTSLRGQNKALRNTADNLQTVIEVRNDVDAKSDADVRNRLDEWVRDRRP